jgi:hypothetical protein
MRKFEREIPYSVVFVDVHVKVDFAVGRAAYPELPRG